eukprot:354461-Chlamydomonas_euryale.AAC.2
MHTQLGPLPVTLTLTPTHRMRRAQLSRMHAGGARACPMRRACGRHALNEKKFGLQTLYKHMRVCVSQAHWTRRRARARRSFSTSLQPRTSRHAKSLHAQAFPLSPRAHANLPNAALHQCAQQHHDP